MTYNEIFAAASSMTAPWTLALFRAFGDSVPVSTQWDGSDAILNVLRPFAVSGLNVLHQPGTGRAGCVGVRPGAAAGSIELQTTAGELSCRSNVLHFEHFPEMPSESFFMLETLVQNTRTIGTAARPTSILLVSACSVWDVDLADYDGGHVGLTASQVRRRIVRAMDFIPGMVLAAYSQAATSQGIQATAGI